MNWGGRRLLECPSDTDTDLSVDFALCTQQTFDFVADLDFDDFTSVDATVEGLLAEAEAEAKADVQLPSKNIRRRQPAWTGKQRVAATAASYFFSASASASSP